MTEKFLTVFAPPIQSDFYRARLQTNLRAILIIMITSFACVFVFNSDFGSRLVSGSMIILLTVLATLFIRGDMIVARLVAPMAAFIGISYLALDGFGIHSVAVPAFWTLVVCCRALGSGTSAVFYTVASMITLGICFYLERIGYDGLSLPGRTANPVELLNLYIGLIACLAAVWFLAKNIEDDRDVAYDAVEELRHNEAILFEKERQYRLLADNAQDMIWTADLDLCYTYSSPASERIVGYRPDELIGKSIFYRLCPEDAVEHYRNLFSREMEMDSSSRDPFRDTFAEVQVIRKDGAVIWIEAHISLLRDDNQEPIGLVGTSRDVTDRIEAEAKAKEISDQLKQSQKIDSIGQLAGGIAHDFNNMLVAIQGYSDLAAKHKSAPKDVKRYVSEIKKAAIRAENLTRQLLTFSRRQAMESKPISVNTLLSNLQDMLSRLIPANIVVKLDLHNGDNDILGDSSQLEQLIVNLCVNARDSMPGGGVLSIRSRAVALSDKDVSVFPNAVAGDYICLSVEDDGTGMDTEVQKRIFEPFFTTKKEGQGTGLGLSVVHGIIVEHGGFVAVDSEPGAGTRIHVYLPRADNLTQSRTLIEMSDASPRGKETVLVVEDEEQVRDLATLVLSQAGYTVLTAADGMLGWELFLSQQESIALIVCDVVMPNMGGRQLLRLVREIDDSVPFVFTSGYVGGPDPKNFAERYGVEFLQKPFSAANLQQIVRSTLDSRAKRLPRQKLVLAVDDNASILHLLELDVQELGHKILTTTYGEQAVALCNEHEFDLIFMDIQMAPMNGIDATKKIRSMPEVTAKIYGLTAHFTDDEKTSCLAAGMDDVITKPIRFDKLASLLGGKHCKDEAVKPELIPKPLFDLDVSLHLANNRTDIAEEMLDILISKLPEDLGFINSAFDRDDQAEFGRQVHKLNGAVRYCGVPALSESINRLETVTKNSQFSDIEACLAELNTRINELLEWKQANPTPFNLHRLESG